MKKVIVVITIVVIIMLSYFVGFWSGTHDVIEKQIITNEEHQKGFYESEYHGQVNRYWFE